MFFYFVCLAFICRGVSLQYQWLEDIVYLRQTAVQLNTSWSLTVNISSNGPIFSGESLGHFKVVLSGNYSHIPFYGQSSCINIAGGGSTAANILKSMSVVFADNSSSALALSKLPISVRVQKYKRDSANKWEYNIFSMILTPTDWANFLIDNVAISQSQCNAPRVQRSWQQTASWIVNGAQPSSLPGIGDSVTFGNQSGVAILSSDVSIGSLLMSGGLIIAAQSSCPSDWSSDPTSLRR